MKKSLLFGFAAAMTLASCTTNDEILGTAEQTAMEFSSFVNKSTKAPVDNLNFDGSTFGVWGYKGKDTATPTQPIFDTQGTTNGTTGTVGGSTDRYKTITCTKSGNTYTWSYTPLRFWDKTCKYEFYAFAPVNTAVKASIDNNKVITIADFSVNEVITDQIDLMMADKITRAKNTVNNVQFNFRHLLTKVNIQFLKSEALKEADVVLRSAKLNNIGNKATYTSTTDNAAYAWGSTSEKIGFTSVNTDKTLDGTTAVNMFADMLMIPQTFVASTEATPFTMDITYTINGETFTRNIYMGSTAWTKNMNILYTLTIDANAIIFDNPTITEDWQTPTTGVASTIE